MIIIGINGKVRSSAYISNMNPEIHSNTAVSRQMPSLKAVHNVVGFHNQKKFRRKISTSDDSYEVNMDIKLLSTCLSQLLLLHLINIYAKVVNWSQLLGATLKIIKPAFLLSS